MNLSFINARIIVYHLTRCECATSQKQGHILPHGVISVQTTLMGCNGPSASPLSNCHLSGPSFFRPNYLSFTLRGSLKESVINCSVAQLMFTSRGGIWYTILSVTGFYCRSCFNATLSQQIVPVTIFNWSTEYIYNRNPRHTHKKSYSAEDRKRKNVFTDQIRAIPKVAAETCSLYRAVRWMITHEQTHLLLYWPNK